MAPQLQHCGGSKELEVGELAAKEAEALAFLQWLRRKRFYLDMDLTEEMQGMKAVTEQMFGGLLQTLVRACVHILMLKSRLAQRALARTLHKKMATQ
eukprot:391106-Pelagomonas_calceolata.AAC.6